MMVSESEVQRYVYRAAAAQGRPLVSLEQLWRLAVAWYANRLTPEARRPMGEEIRAIFDGLGLTDPFWRVQ